MRLACGEIMNDSGSSAASCAADDFCRGWRRCRL